MEDETVGPCCLTLLLNPIGTDPPIEPGEPTQYGLGWEGFPVLRYSTITFDLNSIFV